MKRTRKPLMLLGALLALGPMTPAPGAAPGRPAREKRSAVRPRLDREPSSCPEPATLTQPTYTVPSKTQLALAPRPVSSSCGALYLSGEMTLIAQAFIAKADPSKGIAHLVGGGGLGGFNLPCVGCPKRPMLPVGIRIGDTWIPISPGGPPSNVPVAVLIHPCTDLLIVGTLHVAFNANGQLDGSRSSLDLHGSVDLPPL